MTQPAIKIEGLGKSYRIGLREKASATFREALVNLARTPIERLRRLGEHSADGEDVFWALRGVGFEVQPGEVVGIVGRNGAGKSTLLKVLSRITEPTEGRVTIRGRVASLLEVGTGFHPELTGRENIYLNGAILGMRRVEIERKFDAIVDFSGVEKFLDTPVKHYSSGMRVRLGFAVAAHLEPEVLIVDEVLAVGDAEFQAKCLGKMKDVAGSGRTVLFVSHNMSAVRGLCTRAVLMRQGKLCRDGAVGEVIDDYLTYLVNTADSALSDDNPERSGTGAVRLTRVGLVDERREPMRDVAAGRPACIELGYENPSRAGRISVGMTIYNALGVAVTHLNSEVRGASLAGLSERGAVWCDIPRLPLPMGRYRLAVMVQAMGQTADLVPNALVFDVTTSAFYPTTREPDPRYSACLVDHAWSHEVGVGLAAGGGVTV